MGRVVSAEEHQRRLDSYDQGGSVLEMADRIGVQRPTYYLWLRTNHLPIKERKYKERASIPYVHTRPLWERECIREFMINLLEGGKREL